MEGGTSEEQQEALRRASRRCLEVAHLLADRRRGGPVRVVDMPGGSVRVAARVDLVAADSVGEWAMRYCAVESFPGQVADEAEVKALFAPVLKELDGNIGAIGSFDLAVPPNITEGLDVRRAQRMVAAWVQEKGPKLAIGSAASAQRHVAEGDVPDVPFPVRLSRWQGHQAGGSIRLIRYTPGELDALRHARLRAAFDRTLPTLALWSGEERSAVLVLEELHGVVIDVGPVVEVVRRAASGRHDIPDVVVLIARGADGRALAHVVKDGARWWSAGVKGDDVRGERRAVTGG